MGIPGRTDDHQWSQRHLSHYVEGDLRPRAQRRLDRHARGCVDCGRGIRAMRALVYAVQGLGGLAACGSAGEQGERVRSGGPGGEPSSSRA